MCRYNGVEAVATGTAGRRKGRHKVLNHAGGNHGATGRRGVEEFKRGVANALVHRVAAAGNSGATASTYVQQGWGMEPGTRVQAQVVIKCTTSPMSMGSVQCLNNVWWANTTYGTTVINAAERPVSAARTNPRLQTGIPLPLFFSNQHVAQFVEYQHRWSAGIGEE